MHARIQWLGLLLGPILAGVTMTLWPTSYVDGVTGEWVTFTWSGRATLSLTIWMAVWWLTEATNMSVTALLPLALFPLFGVATLEEAASHYANPLIYLYMGGFLLALAMQRWRLDRRIALMAISQVGTRPDQIVAGFMAVTGALSAFVSNTATAAMMLPIALSVLRLTDSGAGPLGEQGAPLLTNGKVIPENVPESIQKEADHGMGRRNLGPCLMLGIAYAASIGGIATIVGTPTNLFLVSYLKGTIPVPYRIEVSFLRWLGIGLPLTLIYLPLTWWLLVKILYPVGRAEIAGSRALIRRELEELGRVRRGEWMTLLMFSLTALLWIFLPLIKLITLPFAEYPWRPFSALSDPGIVLLTSLTLFVIPVDIRRREFVLDWKTAEQLPWGILILFGGGLSLAAAISGNGVAEFLGSFAHYLAGTPPWLIVTAVTAGVIFLTELTSNTATTAAVVPILVALAPGLGLHPYWLAIPATLAASCAFMLPVATPPNALVFAGGYITLSQMIRAGWWLNLIGIALIVGLSNLILGPLFGI